MVEVRPRRVFDRRVRLFQHQHVGDLPGQAVIGRLPDEPVVGGELGEADALALLAVAQPVGHHTVAVGQEIPA